MKYALATAFVLLLIVPGAEAQRASSLHVGVYEIQNVAAPQGDALVALSMTFPNSTAVDFWVMKGATPMVRTASGARAASLVRSEGDFDLWRLNGTLGAGETLLVEHRASSDTVAVKLAASAPALIVLAQPLSGRSVSAPNLAFAANEDGYWSAQLASPQANQTLTLTFTGEATAPEAGGGSIVTRDQTPWVYAIAGLLLGMLLFWLMVRQGWVSAPGKAKKFIKGGTMESTRTLEARRRTLMAALKELEHAHEAKEIADDVYFPLKEEYKQQAVRVMRTLEEKKEA